MIRLEMQDKLELSDRMNFLNNYLQPAISNEIIEMTIPDKPKSSKQKYRLTKLGSSFKEA